MLEELGGWAVVVVGGTPALAGDLPTNGFNLLLLPNTRRP